jgi:hypothetical protein
VTGHSQRAKFCAGGVTGPVVWHVARYSPVLSPPGCARKDQLPAFAAAFKPSSCNPPSLLRPALLVRPWFLQPPALPGHSCHAAVPSKASCAPQSTPAAKTARYRCTVKRTLTCRRWALASRAWPTPSTAATTRPATAAVIPPATLPAPWGWEGACTCAASEQGTWGTSGYTEMCGRSQAAGASLCRQPAAAHRTGLHQSFHLPPLTHVAANPMSTQCLS